MLTPKKRNILIRLDTETGKNLGELTLSFDEKTEQPFTEIAPNKKFSQLESQNTVKIVGTSENSIFNMEWDTRMSADQIVIGKEQRQTLSQKNLQFTSIATTKSGNIAVGDNNGIIRMYQSPELERLKRSKTNLDQLSDHIRYVDISSDGEWIVWTTKEYLAVVNTIFETEKGKYYGFMKSMGNKKPNALILRVSKALMNENGIQELDFNSGRFDNGPSQNKIIENDLVASSGNFLFRWNFRKVKLEYKNENHSDSRLNPIIYKQKSKVVDQAFEYGNRNVIAALEKNIQKINLDHNKLYDEEEEEDQDYQEEYVDDNDYIDEEEEEDNEDGDEKNEY